jgi:hypothetical protein
MTTVRSGAVQDRTPMQVETAHLNLQWNPNLQ